MLDEEIRPDLAMLHFIIVNSRETLQNDIHILEVLHIHQIYDISSTLIRWICRRS